MGIREAIFETVKYAERFGCTVSKDEVKGRLIGAKYYKEDEINKVLSDYEGLKKNGNRFWKGKLKKAKKAAKIIGKKIPTIKFIGLTGSVAAKYPKKNDDIDFMIVTQKNRLWSSRLLLKVFLVLTNTPHRKQGRKEKGDDLCFNLWLDANKLLIPKEKRNFKNAVDLIIMIPLLDKENYYQKLLQDNRWARNFVKTPYENKIKHIMDETEAKNIFEPIGKLINTIAFFGQHAYLKKKMAGGEWVDIYQAFFSPTN